MARRSPPPKPSLRDVARAAGVSVTTASFVVNDRRDMRIAADTRARVLAVVDDLGFRPDPTAQHLRTRRTHTIGFITDEIASSPFAGRIILGAQDVTWHSGRLLFLVNTGMDPQVEAAATRVLLDRRVDGVLYASMSARGLTVPEELHRVPLVLINCFDADSDVPAVLTDEMYGSALATQRLIEAGHRRIVYIAGDRHFWATTQRVRAFRTQMRAAKLPTARGAVSYGTYDIDSGHARAMDLLRQDDRPTALLCGNDRIAVGALLAARECGLDVPGDLSLVGYDDQEELADRVTPPLTTVSLPHFDMGRVGAEALLRLVQGESVSTGLTVRGALVERASVGRPPTVTV